MRHTVDATWYMVCAGPHGAWAGAFWAIIITFFHEFTVHVLT